MDFGKFRIPTHRYKYLYRCAACGEETWYTVDLPEHMLTHTRLFRWEPKCGGRLDLTAMWREGR